MIEVSVGALLVFMTLVLLSSVAGILLSKCMSWSGVSKGVRLDYAVGLALGPFLFGVGSVIGLGFFRGFSHETHLFVLVAFLVLIILVGARLRLRPDVARFIKHKPTLKLELTELILLSAVVFAAVVLMFTSIFLPLTQNDALEYAVVARELYATRDLLTYPVLNSQTNLSGIYAPWTHPPLYVALLYMAEVIQGDSAVPGLMRLISPWFLLVGAYVVYSLGCFINRTTGLLAALFFISPPLFFLGATSALLDPLPVLGFTITVAAITGISANPVKFGAVVGSFVGLALWTHSQAVLFLPLGLAAICIERGVRDLRSLILCLFSFSLVALVIASWPYWRNVEVFGAAISDNPAVFIIPQLHWDDYFSIARGVDTTAAIIQYGVFKGWFAVEPYGFIFWGMTVGLLLFFIGRRTADFKRLLLDGAGTFQKGEAILWLVSSLFVIYMLGVVFSVFLGIEHMVKNERYLLVTLPLVVLICSFGCMKIFGMLFPQVRFVRITLYSALATVFFLQVSVFVYYRSVKHGVSIHNFTASMADKLYFSPEYDLFKKNHGGFGEDSLVMSIKPADMYYANARMLSYLDERLLPFYAESDTIKAYQMLQDLGVTHVHLPDYGLPPLYNSRLFSIISDPALSTLVSQTVAGQIYALRPETLNPTTRVDLSPNERPWTFSTFIVLGGRKGFARSEKDAFPLSGLSYSTGLPYDIFHRQWMAQIKTGIPADGMLPDKATGILIDPSSQYRIDLKVGGKGFVKVSVDQFSGGANGDPIKVVSSRLITSFELSSNQPKREYSARFVTEPNATWMAVSIETVGRSNLVIEEISYTALRKL